MKLIAAAGAASLLVVAGCDPVDSPVTLLAPGTVASPAVRGQFIASRDCAPCHGVMLRGDSANGVHAPSLVQARGYTWAEFNTLLNAGVTRNGHRVSNVMVTTDIYGQSPDDRRALFDYLVINGAP